MVRPVASLLVIVTHAMQMFASTGSIFYGAIVLESEASRHVFFFVAALVLTYQAYRRPRWSPWPAPVAHTRASNAVTRAGSAPAQCRSGGGFV